MEPCIKLSVINFIAMDGIICISRIRARFNITALICVYAPTEETEEDIKHTFYQKLEDEHNSITVHDVRIMLGDLNTKIGIEEFQENHRR